MRTVQIRLLRFRPPWVRRVTVGQITVGGFMDLVRRVSLKVAEVRVQFDRDVSHDDILRSLREPELCAVADAVVTDQEPEFLRRWMSLRNVKAILYASTKTNNWERLAECVNLGTAPRKGSILTDLTALCRIFPGLTPPAIRQWPMEEFLDVCEALNMASAPSDPTLDDTVRPAPLSALSHMRGVETLH